MTDITKVATIILNRNLPHVTDKLYSYIKEYDSHISDIFVIESGSDSNNLSKNVTWHADWDEVKLKGLRYSRGINYGLSKLTEESKFENYDAFLFLTNDTEFENSHSVTKLAEIMGKHPKLGILSPCSKRWGEYLLLKEKKIKYFWYIHNNAYMFRKSFILDVMHSKPNYMNYLFDGSNFRGYGSEMEIIAKCYSNDWAAAITSEVLVNENETYLLKQSDLIKTDSYEENMRLYLAEGKEWMKNKYGFDSKWSMQMYVKLFYDRFFEFYPEYMEYKI